MKLGTNYYQPLGLPMRLKFFLLIGGLVGLSFAGYTVYNYFFDTTYPLVEISGIEQNGYYSGDVPCVIIASDGYKVSYLTLFLDGKPLINRHRINRSSCEYPFTLATKTIPNGKHTVKCLVEDGSYQHNVTEKEVAITVDNNPLQAVFVKPESELRVFQGRTLHVQFQVNKEIKEAKIKALTQVYNCYQEAPHSLVYDCYIPIKTDQTPNEYLFTVEIVDCVGNVVALDNKFQVVMFPFKKQNLVLNNEKIKKENELGLSERQLEADLATATQNSPAQKLWQGAFYGPCDIKGVSTDFGTLRVTQERGKYPHNALDLMGSPKSVVWATQDGIVVIKNRYAHSGNTIVIDHGCGILSLFFHLDSFAAINVGDKIKKGNPVGTLGMTGYASGYHLHWEMRINNIAIDPMQWTRPDF